MTGQFRLLAEPRFGPFFCTQFLGAFNDNVFKNALVVLLTFRAASWTRLAPELLANLAAGIFILPFFLFSASAGQIADKFDKASIARLVKLFEIAVMTLAACGFALHSLPLLLAALFLMGLHSTLFGPVKYAILPQALAPDELIAGNALVEAGTFVAILLGTLSGALLAGLDHGAAWISVAVIGVAVLGYLASRGIPSASAAAPRLVIGRNPVHETLRCLGLARASRDAWRAILGISWFWLYGAVLLAQFPAYAKHVLQGGESAVTLLLAIFTIGVGAGSLACGWLARSRSVSPLVPLGAIGMTLFGFDFALASPGAGIDTALPLPTLLGDPLTWRLLADLLLLGASGGCYCVPLYALMQRCSPEESRARTIAANNIVNALYMVVGATVAALLLARGISIPGLIGLLAACNLVIALWLRRAMPDLLARTKR